MLIFQTAFMQWSYTGAIVELAFTLVLGFIYCRLLIVLRKKFPGFWAVCVTEIGATTGYLFISIILIVTSLLISPWTWQHSSKGVIMDLGANILGDILVWLIILTALWFGYFRYRKLSHVVSLRSKHSCCWKILWTCSTFGVELLINPRFVLGMKKSNDRLTEQLLTSEEGPLSIDRLMKNSISCQFPTPLRQKFGKTRGHLERHRQPLLKFGDFWSKIGRGRG